MEQAFVVVVFVVVAVAVVVALLTLRGAGDAYRQVGRGGLSLDRAPAPDDREAELRQLLEASSARRERRGEAPLDVEAEVERRLRELGG